MNERQMFLAHDLRLTLESKLWAELNKAYEEGRMTEQEIEEAYLDWTIQHPDIEK